MGRRRDASLRLFLRCAIGVVLLAFLGCASSEPAVPSCPVCGAVVNPQKAVKVTYAGKTYYFDSEECAKEFFAHAAAYSGQRTRHVGSR